MGMTTVSPAEVEFIAEEETVKITSRFELDRRELICGDFGPFKPGVPTKVPLWMAVNLKQRGLCILHTPSWLSVERLSTWLEDEEKNDDKASKPVHAHYREVSRIILKNCADSIKDVDQLSQLIEDIWNVRKAKLKASIDHIEKERSEGDEPITANGGFLNISDYTQLEINYIRTMFTESLNNSWTIAKRTNEVEQRTEQ